MSVWDNYPNLSPADLRSLVAVTAQVLIESDTGTADISADLLQQSTATNAKEIQKLLEQEGVNVPRDKVLDILDDEEKSVTVVRMVLDHVRAYPELSERISDAFEARKQKMTGIELTLLAGALVVLAMRIKLIKRDGSGLSIDFEPSGDAVKSFVTGLVKSQMPT